MTDTPVLVWKSLWLWYRSKPWWAKVLLAVPVLLIVALALVAAGVLAPFGPKKKTSDQAHADTTNTAVELADKRDKKLVEAIAVKQDEVKGLVAAGKLADSRAAEVRERIEKASSIDEIDEIIRGIR